MKERGRRGGEGSADMRRTINVLAKNVGIPICTFLSPEIYTHQKKKKERWCLSHCLLVLIVKRHHFQVIKMNESATLFGECLGDTIILGKPDVWEIKINTKTGTIDSWKVVLFVHLFLHATILFFHWTSPLFYICCSRP